MVKKTGLFWKFFGGFIFLYLFLSLFMIFYLTLEIKGL